MDTITLIKGDSSDIYEFYSKEVTELDDNWEGSWVISENLGTTPIIQGNLIKNGDILNNDALIDEDYKKSYKLFESQEGELLRFTNETISTTTNNNDTLSLAGFVYTEATDGTEVPVVNRYVYITIKGVFKKAERTLRVQTDENGEFTAVFDLNKTIKTPANSFFIFQILPHESEQLELGDYMLSVEIRQDNGSGTLLFRKEVMQSKLKIQKQGVLPSTYTP